MGSRDDSIPDETDEELNEALDSITVGGGISIVAMLVHRLINLAAAGLLTTGLGPSGYGLYALGMRLHTFMRALTRGARTTVERFLAPASTHEEEERTLTFAVLAVTVSSLIGAGALFLLAPQITSFTSKPDAFVVVLKAAAVAIPFGSLVVLSAVVFRARGEHVVQNLVLHIGVPSLGLIAGGISVLVVMSAPLAMTTVAVLSGVLCLVTMGALFAHGNYRFRNPLEDIDHTKEMGRYTTSLFLTQVLGAIQSYGYYLPLTYFVSPTAAGAYAISMIIGTFVRLPLDGVNHIVPPVASSLNERGSMDTLVRLHRIKARLIFTTNAVVLAYILAYYTEILALFDPVYQQYSILIIMLAVAHFVASGVGSVGILLTMTDHEDAHLAYNVFVTVLMAVTSIGLGSAYGVEGIAASFMFILITNNAGQLLMLYVFEGFQPFTRHHLIPVLAAIVAGIVFVTIDIFLSGIPLLVGGGCAGAAAYVAVLHYIGLPDKDAKFLKQLLPLR